MSEILLIGVGNDFRGDDGAGLEVARRLRARRPAGIRVVESSGDAGALVSTWRDWETVLLVDALSSELPPGTVLRLDALGSILESGLFAISSHAFGVCAAVELARTLGQLPGSLTIFGVVGADFSEGKGLSTRALEGVLEAESLVLEELEKLDRAAPETDTACPQTEHSTKVARKSVTAHSPEN